MRVAMAVAVLGLSVAAWAKDKEPEEKFKLIKADKLASMMNAKDAKVVVYDANDDGFRQKNGIIEGAKLLSSFNKYDVAKELPAAKDTPVVFYCSNSH